MSLPSSWPFAIVSAHSTSQAGLSDGGSAPGVPATTVGVGVGSAVPHPARTKASAPATVTTSADERLTIVLQFPVHIHFPPAGANTLQQPSLALTVPFASVGRRETFPFDESSVHVVSDPPVKNGQLRHDEDCWAAMLVSQPQVFNSPPAASPVWTQAAAGRGDYRRPRPAGPAPKGLPLLSQRRARRLRGIHRSVVRRRRLGNDTPELRRRLLHAGPRAAVVGAAAPGGFRREPQTVPPALLARTVLRYSRCLLHGGADLPSACRPAGRAARPRSATSAVAG